MSRNTGPSPAVVRLVMERSEGHCDMCGGYLHGNRGYDWSIHHRAPRRMGGTRRPEINQPSNLLAVCGHSLTGCHFRIESNRLWATEMGLLVPSYADPSTTPAYLRWGLVLLGDDGTWSYGRAA